MPVYNEECHIEGCIESLLKQDYPREKMELLFVDGNSSDNTFFILQKYQKLYPGFIKVLSNPRRTIPCGCNMGIRAAQGDYIIRLDAHAKYADNYISKCVQYLSTTDIDNVGGFAKTEAKGYIGEAISKILSSAFGVGNARFRIGGKSGEADTVPFGAFKREVFEKYGMFDERLDRNEDNELNDRIKKNGGKIYLAEDIRFTYYCRDSLSKLAKMAFSNGKWNFVTNRIHKGTMGIKYFVPFLFLLSILLAPLCIILLPWSAYLFFAEAVMYFLLDICFCIKDCGKIKYIPAMIFLFPFFHLSYGAGTLCALFISGRTLKKQAVRE